MARFGAADFYLLRGKRVFVTGGTGFFGKWLIAGLQQAGAKVTVLSRDPEAFIRQFPEAASFFAFIRGDVATFSQEVGTDFILHGAADSSSVVDEAERCRVIVEGTRRMVTLAKKNHARLLFVSSGAVYGALAGQPGGAKEEDGVESLTAYGEAKREAERLCADHVTGRAFAFLGPWLPLDAHFAAGNFLRDAIRGGPVLVRGDGTALRSYLYPADLVVWLLRLLVRGESGRAYNVGSDEFVTTAELARRIAEQVEPRPEVVIQSLQPQGPQNIYVPDIARARAELRLEVAIPLRDAIARTLEFLSWDKWR